MVLSFFFVDRGLYVLSTSPKGEFRNLLISGI